MRFDAERGGGAAISLARKAPGEAEAERLLGASRSALSKRLGLETLS